jgi:hypothetical protein
MIAALKAYFEHGISPGEAIIITISTVPLLISFILWLRKVRFPLFMEFHIPGSSERYRRSQQVPEGEWPIKIRLKARTPQHIRAIDIRFVEKRSFRKPLNAAQEIIEIRQVTKIEWGDQLSPGGCSHSSNGVGGFVIHVVPFKTWAQGDYLYLHFRVVAKAPWRGYLSFEARSDCRLYVRSSFSILQDAFTGSF